MRTSVRRVFINRITVPVLATWLASAASAGAETFIVNNSADVLGANAGNGRCETASGNGVCTFRRAMWEASQLLARAAAAASRASVTILVDVPSGVLTFAPGTWLFQNGLLNGPGDVTIVGAGPTATVIDANNAMPAGSAFPFLAVNIDALQISGLTIRGARLPIHFVRDTGSLRLEHVRIENSAIWGLNFGGAQGWIIESEFAGNQTGAIYMDHPVRLPSAGVLRIERSLFRNNRTTNGGAIVTHSGTIELNGTTFSGNQATGSGGAVALLANSALKATNTTFSGNTANGSGGAVYVDSDLTETAQVFLAHVTFANNTADANLDGTGSGGALAVTAETPNRVSVRSSLFSGNAASVASGGGFATTPSACAGAVTSTTVTLFDVTDCTVTGTTVSGAANLGSLQNNGGPTSTHALQAGSPAIDRDAAPCQDASGNTLGRDQRGRTRPVAAGCDLGAVESGGVVITRGLPYDLNGDGKSDLLWRHDSRGLTGAWLMNGSTIDSLGSWSFVTDPSWKPLGSDDFDGDGKSDLAWWHQVHGLGIWLMNGLTPQASRAVLARQEAPSTERRLAGTGDLDNDGRADLVLELYSTTTGQSTGQTEVWLMDGTALKGIKRLPVASGWHVVGVADADGNGTGDLLWRNEASGGMVLWFMANGAIAAVSVLPTVSEPGWVVAGFADINGNNRADVIWRHVLAPSPSPIVGATAVWLLEGPVVVRAEYLPNVVHDEWRLVQVLDTDGDQRADIIWRGSTGQNVRWRMDGLTVLSSDVMTPVTDLGWEIR